MKYEVKLLKLLDDGPPRVISTLTAEDYRAAREIGTALLMNPLDPYDPSTPPERLAVNVVQKERS